MKLRLHYVVVLLLALLITGCGKELQETELDVVFVGPPSTETNSKAFPDDLKSLVQPIEDNPKVDIALYPINLMRADIGKKAKLDYETNKSSTNYQKIKAVERDLNAFLKTEAPQWLFLPQKASFDLNNYIKQNSAQGNIFMFTENVQTAPAGVRAFNSIGDLRKAMSTFISAPTPDKKSTKLIVIYQLGVGGVDSTVVKPDTGKVTTQDGDAIGKQGSNASSSSPGSPKNGSTQVVRTYTHAAMSSNVAVSSNLQQNMQSLVKGNLNAEEKEVLKQAILRKVEPDTKVYLYKGDQLTRVSSIEQYLENLILTPKMVNRVITIDNTKKFEEGKIYDIYIHETTTELP